MRQATTYQAVVHTCFGPPEEVLQIEKRLFEPLGHRQVLIAVQAAPINPADINKIEGRYGTRPELPAIAGSEGVGVVKQVGDGVSHLRCGDQVLLPTDVGTWREYITAEAQSLSRLPVPLPVEDAAMLSINPPTALRMLTDFATLQPGEWIIQNAANSGVGRAIIQIARWRGIKTVNVVRRQELIQRTRRLGGDLVLCDDDHLADNLKNALPNAQIKLGLNAVGGASALRLAFLLAEGGTLVTYGAMSKQSLKIPNSLLIFKQIQFRGFWISQWRKTASRIEYDAMINQLAMLVQQGVLKSKIERIYPIHLVHEAVTHAQQEGRSGKILLRFNPAPGN